MALIHEKLLAIQKEISYIGKDKKNTMQNFNYRGVDDVYHAFHPLFAKHNVLCKSEILREHQVEFEKGQGKFKSGRVYIIRYYFVADDGSEYWTDVAGEGVDDSDKASNKAMAAGHKYAILQAFTVPTEAYDDPDAHGEVDTGPLKSPKEEWRDKWISTVNSSNIEDDYKTIFLDGIEQVFKSGSQDDARELMEDIKAAIK